MMGPAADYETNTVEAAHFRSYHTVIQTQQEYINGTACPCTPGWSGGRAGILPLRWRLSAELTVPFAGMWGQRAAAYVAALRVCDQVMEKNPGVSCFPYTIFYVYFEQYLNIIAVMVIVLALAASTRSHTLRACVHFTYARATGRSHVACPLNRGAVHGMPQSRSFWSPGSSSARRAAPRSWSAWCS